MGNAETPEPAGILGRARARLRRRCAYCRERGCAGGCPQYQAVRNAELRWDEARAAARRAASVPPAVLDNAVLDTAMDKADQPAGTECARRVRPSSPPA